MCGIDATASRIAMMSRCIILVRAVTIRYGEQSPNSLIHDSRRDTIVTLAAARTPAVQYISRLKNCSDADTFW